MTSKQKNWKRNKIFSKNGTDQLQKRNKNFVEKHVMKKNIP